MICYDKLVETNIQPLIDKASAVLKMWSKRDLSLAGKIQIVNSLVGSLFVYRFTVLPTLETKWYNVINQMIVNFIWSFKRSKIKLDILTGLKDDGGAGLVNIYQKHKSLKIQWIWKTLNNSQIKALAEDAIASELSEKIWRI